MTKEQSDKRDASAELVTACHDIIGRELLPTATHIRFVTTLANFERTLPSHEQRIDSTEARKEPPRSSVSNGGGARPNAGAADTGRTPDVAMAENVEAGGSPAVSTPSTTPQKPVAWRWRWNGGDEPDVWSYCEYEPNTKYQIREPLYAAPVALPSAIRQTAQEDEAHFILNGYERKWRSYSHFNGSVVSYEDVVEWSGIDSDRERIRERVYTVTYAMPNGSGKRGGTLAAGESVPFESGMVFNVTRTTNA